MLTLLLIDAVVCLNATAAPAQEPARCSSSRSSSRGCVLSRRCLRRRVLRSSQSRRRSSSSSRSRSMSRSREPMLTPPRLPVAAQFASRPRNRQRGRSLTERQALAAGAAELLRLPGAEDRRVLAAAAAQQRYVSSFLALESCMLRGALSPPSSRLLHHLDHLQLPLVEREGFRGVQDRSCESRFQSILQPKEIYP